LTAKFAGEHESFLLFLLAAVSKWRL
jgi:hypothetical protein